MAQYKLIYYDGLGWAEPIRQILYYSGTPFEDVRLAPGEPLTPIETKELGLEWGVVPMLEVNGEKKAQSYAICRFLAKRFNMTGKNESEEFRCDEIVEAVRDWSRMSEPMWKSTYIKPNPVKSEREKTKFVKVVCPDHLMRFDKLLEKQGKTWFVGDSLTYTDIVFVHNITLFETAFNLQLVKDYPAIQKLVDAVENAPKIKEWIQKRPKTLF